MKLYWENTTLESRTRRRTLQFTPIYLGCDKLPEVFFCYCLTNFLQNNLRRGIFLEWSADATKWLRLARIGGANWLSAGFWSCCTCLPANQMGGRWRMGMRIIKPYHKLIFCMNYCTIFFSRRVPWQVGAGWLRVGSSLTLCRRYQRLLDISPRTLHMQSFPGTCGNQDLV